MFEKEKLPFLGILRGVKDKDLEGLAEVCINCGLQYLEITMNTDNAPQLISKMIKLAENKITIGAGTVLSLQDLNMALSAGAQFIVSPSVVDDVINQCVREKIPIFPGALTPTEVQKAWDLGASMVKLFPASAFGPAYIKELKGPFNKIRLMAVGGINEINISEYFACGADAIAFGAGIFNLKWMNENRYDLIGEKMSSLIVGYNKNISF
jgi:2-dehydro-3-deoxyphosphogluconate aldolase/(4S)-4-hydroxy-2-oxoglutarate aldolase